MPVILLVIILVLTVMQMMMLIIVLVAMMKVLMMMMMMTQACGDGDANDDANDATDDGGDVDEYEHEDAGYVADDGDRDGDAGMMRMKLLMMIRRWYKRR